MWCCLRTTRGIGYLPGGPFPYSSMRSSLVRIRQCLYQHRESLLIPICPHVGLPHPKENVSTLACFHVGAVATEVLKSKPSPTCQHSSVESRASRVESSIFQVESPERRVESSFSPRIHPSSHIPHPPSLIPHPTSPVQKKRWHVEKLSCWRCSA